MELFNQMNPRFGHPGGFGHHGWALFGLLPLILWAILIGVAIWGVLRITSRRAVLVPAASAPVAMAPRPDGALEEVRLGYARGEMSREEFVQRSKDLGGAEPAPEPVDPPSSNDD
jgi:putative membrane protein